MNFYMLVIKFIFSWRFSESINFWCRFWVNLIEGVQKHELWFLLDILNKRYASSNIFRKSVKKHSKQFKDDFEMRTPKREYRNIFWIERDFTKFLSVLDISDRAWKYLRSILCEKVFCWKKIIKKQSIYPFRFFSITFQTLPKTKI